MIGRKGVSQPTEIPTFVESDILPSIWTRETQQSHGLPSHEGIVSLTYFGSSPPCASSLLEIYKYTSLTILMFYPGHHALRDTYEWLNESQVASDPKVEEGQKSKYLTSY
jgi:hypothetical protein